MSNEDKEIKKVRLMMLDCCMNEVDDKLPDWTGCNLEITPNGLLRIGEEQSTGDGGNRINKATEKI